MACGKSRSAASRLKSNGRRFFNNICSGQTVRKTFLHGLGDPTSRRLQILEARVGPVLELLHCVPVVLDNERHLRGETCLIIWDMERILSYKIRWCRFETLCASLPTYPSPINLCTQTSHLVAVMDMSGMSSSTATATAASASATSTVMSMGGSSSCKISVSSSSYLM